MPKLEPYNKLSKGFDVRLICYYLALVIIGWIIFRADSIGQAWDYMGHLFNGSLFTRPDAAGVTGFTLTIVLMVVAEWLQRKREHALDIRALRWPVLRFALDAAVVFLIIVLGGHSENFIYFQF